MQPTPKTKKFKSTRRKKQLLIMAAGLLIGGVMLVAITSINSSKVEKNKAEKAQKVERTEKATQIKPVSSLIDQNSSWRDNEGARLQGLEAKNSELTKRLEELSQNKGELPPTPMGNLPPPPPRPLPEPPGAGLAEPVNLNRIKTINLSADLDSPSLETPGKGKANNNPVTVMRDIRPNIHVIDDGGTLTREKRINLNRNPGEENRVRARESFIPSGTYIRSVLLGGLDAPTGGDASSANPHPVLLKVVDFANLPNGFKQDLRGCLITGSGYGDISSERAMLRTDRLSCVYEDGSVIEIPIKGAVYGEDGKAGMRGRLIEKQGQILANALLAGLIGGIGEGISSTYSVTTQGAFGTQTSVSPSDSFKAGTASGVGQAMTRMQEYYIKLADKIFPVIEVNAGRYVDIMALQGVQIDGGSSN
jgi:conjugal transfer pilus assembly protein TraB